MDYKTNHCDVLRATGGGPRDAILAAGRYLHATGAPERMERAIWWYNHDNEYVDAVMKYGEVMRNDPSAFRGRPVRALSAIAPGGARVVALIQPVYLRFVRVLWCRFSPDEGVFWARHDSLVSEADAPRSGTVVDGLSLEPTPLPPVVEELAHAILAHRRRGAELPSSLREFADLFDTDVEAIDGLV